MTTAPGSSTWKKEDIERLLKEEDFAYQDIELPYGLSTGGHDRSATAARILPADLSGKSVLDLGCSFGFFCFEAIKRGARRVVGIDLDPESIRKARLLAEILGAPVEFEVRNIERSQIEERFDHILCLNLLHHLKNPIAVLDNLIGCANERLVLETASLGRHDRRKVRIGLIAQRMLSRLPIIFVGKAGTRGDRQVQKFFITPSAVQNLLIHQRGFFARIEQSPSEHKDRHITIAEKRRIGHLLVVSGPTSAGKRTLVRQLVANQLPDLAQRLGTPDGAAWDLSLPAHGIDQPMEPVLDRLILRRDFMRPYLRSAMVHERDEANDILETAGRITFVTVWSPPQQLATQITDAEIGPAKGKGNKSARHRKILDLYLNHPDKVIEHYERWFEFAERKSSEHIVVSMRNPVQFFSVAEWRKLIAPAFLGGPPTSRRQ